MPAQQSKSGLLARMGQELVDAHMAVKDNAPNYGNQTLPAGIENGVAQLIELHIGEFKDGVNKGQPFFMASGVVKRPVEKDGLRTFGMRTQIGPEPLCNTPQATGLRKTFKDHWDWVLNQVRILAGIEGEMNLGQTPEEIDANFLQLLDVLTRTKPHFRFRTWKGKKQEIEERDGKLWVGTKGPYSSEEAAKKANPYVGQEPRVTQEWNGSCDFTDDGDGSEGVEAGTQYSPPSQPASQANGATSTQAPTSSREAATRTTRDHTDRTPGASRAAVASAATSTPQSRIAQAPPTPSFDEFGDMDSLISRAEQQDGKAQEELKEFALKAGASEDDIDNATNWAAVAGLAGYRSGKVTGREDEDSTADEPTTAEPVVGGEYKYTPPDRKTNKPGTKTYSCEVIGIDHGKKTVTLKNLDNAKAAPYREVPWDALQVPVG